MNTRQVICYISGFLSGIILIIAGIKMLMIHSAASVGGTATIAEVYYNAMGVGFIGLAIMAWGILISLALKD